MSSLLWTLLNILLLLLAYFCFLLAYFCFLLLTFLIVIFWTNSPLKLSFSSFFIFFWVHVYMYFFFLSKEFLETAFILHALARDKASDLARGLGLARRDIEGFSDKITGTITCHRL